MKPGDRVTWNRAHPERAEMEKDFGPGPFTIRTIEEGAPEGGLWVSLFDQSGRVYLRGQWVRLPEGAGYPAAAPTFHSHWLELA